MISHDHKLIFIHIPKCAGRSIAETFKTRPDHFTANYYASEYEKRWADYDVFTIVRNPYDRLVSIYNYVQQHRRHPLEPIACRENGQTPTFKEWVKRNFEAFKGEFFLGSPEAEWGKDYMEGSPFWFSPQNRWLYNESKKNIRVFNLEYGMTPVYGYLQQHGMIEAIGHANKSDKNGRSFWDYYDNELLEFVNQTSFISEDCKALDYKVNIPSIVTATNQ